MRELALELGDIRRRTAWRWLCERSVASRTVIPRAYIETIFSSKERPELRRQATAELNKGEARNALARAVCFHRLGRLRDRTAELQQHRASGLALVTAAIVLWNTVYLSRALNALHRRGEVVPDSLLAHIAPLGWQHINLTGDYLWSATDAFGADGFRPLRGTRNVTANAA